MARHYPVFLNLEGKRVLVVGGGVVAEEKAGALARAGAKVTVVAPRVNPGLRGLKNAAVRERAFRPRDLSPRPWLVIAATDDEPLNRRVARLCEKAGLWVNVVDRTALCGFILPAVARRGLLSFAVSTGGASPALAKFLKGEADRKLGRPYAALAGALHRLRPALKKVPMEDRKKILAGAFSAGRLGRVRREGVGPWEKFVRERIGKQRGLHGTA